MTTTSPTLQHAATPAPSGRVCRSASTSPQFRSGNKALFLQQGLQRLHDDVGHEDVTGGIGMEDVVHAQRVPGIAGNAFEKKRNEGHAVFFCQILINVLEG